MTYAWEFYEATGSEDTVELISELTNYAVLEESHILVSIDSDVLSIYSGKTMNIVLKVESFLGMSHTATTQVLISSQAVPMVRHKLGVYHTFHVFKPLTLELEIGV